MLSECCLSLSTERLNLKAQELERRLRTLDENPTGRPSYEIIDESSLVIGELFDVRRTLEMLRKWNSCSSESVRQDLLIKNGPVLLPEYKRMLESDLEPSAREQLKAA